MAMEDFSVSLKNFSEEQRHSRSITDGVGVEGVEAI
jgi:hypothetical protein